MRSRGYPGCRRWIIRRYRWAAANLGPHWYRAGPRRQRWIHSKMQRGEAKPGKVMDPVNGLTVDTTTAVKTTSQGQTACFSSEQTLKEFLENSAKFAKNRKG